MRRHFPKQADGCYWGDPMRGICAACWLRICLTAMIDAVEVRILPRLGFGMLGRERLLLAASPVRAMRRIARAPS